MTKEQVIAGMQQFETNRKRITLQKLASYDSQLLDALYKLTSFLPENASYRERKYCILNNISEQPICEVCGKNPLKFLGDRYAYGCCAKCAHNSPIVKQHKVDNLMEKYHVTNAYQIPSVIEKGKQRRLEEHGDPNWNNREKATQTYFELTGYDNASKNPAVKQQKIDTCQKNFGVDNPSQSEEITQQKVETCMKNHGVKFGFQTVEHVVYNSISNLSKRFYQILDNYKIDYKPEFRIYWEDGTHNSYDIKFNATNVLLELNGDFWHANPNKYTTEQELNFPHIGKIKVDDIWKRDAAKKCKAENKGYRVMYLWESDINKMSDAEIIEQLKDMHCI